MIAGPAGVQPVFVQLCVGFFFRTEPVDPAPDILEGRVFRRFTQETALAFLHEAYRITNLTTEQGGRTVLKPSAVVSKPSNAATETAFLFSKVLCA